MQIENTLLADFAEIANGKLYLMGGGWDTSQAAAFPAALRFSVVVGIRVGWEETNQPVPVQIIVEDDDGAALVRMDGEVNVGRPPHLPPGATQLAQLVATIGMNANRAGGFRVRVIAGSGGSNEERQIPFRVVQAQQRPV